MFPTGCPRCLVHVLVLVKKYLAHRPEEKRHSGPFHYAIIQKSDVWYKKQRSRINKIKCQLLLAMASERSLADYEEGDEAEQGQISFILTAVLSANRFRFPVQCFTVCSFNSTIQRLLTCVASVPVRVERGPREGVFRIRAARKMGRS